MGLGSSRPVLLAPLSYPVNATEKARSTHLVAPLKPADWVSSKLLSRLLLLSHLLLLCISPFSPISASTPIVHLEDVDVSEHPHLRARLTVGTPHHIPLTGLEIDHFQITESSDRNLPPLALNTAEKLGLPLRIVFLLQNSGSWERGLMQTRRSLIHLLQRMNAHDEVALVLYSDEATVMQSFSSPQELSATLGKLPNPGMEKRLGAGIEASLALFATEKPLSPRALIVLSDGQDMGMDSDSFSEGLSLMAKRGIPIHTVAWSQSGEWGFENLQHLSKLSHASHQRVAGPESFEHALERIRQSLVKQLVLDWKSALPADGKSHTLTIETRFGGLSYKQTVEIGVPFRPSPWRWLPASIAFLLALLLISGWLWKNRRQPYPRCKHCQRELLPEWPVCLFCLQSAPALLRVVEGTRQGLEFPLGDGLHQIGKAKDNAITLEDSSVSAHHCLLVVENGRVEIQDRRSTNGTFVNDRRVERRSLKNGDRLSLGHCVLELSTRPEFDEIELG